MVRTGLMMHRRLRPEVLQAAFDAEGASSFRGEAALGMARPKGDYPA